MKVTFFALIFLLVGCGGGTTHQQATFISPTPTPTPIPQASPTPSPSPTPTPVPTPTPITSAVTITASSVLNMGMIGQTWTFQNGFGAINTFEIQAAPPNAGCRDGNSLVIHMTKTAKNTYWQLGADQAELWFVLNQSADGSWRSTASLVNMPLGSTFSGPIVISADVIDNQAGMPAPYMIAPPTTSTGDDFINETRSLATGAPGLSFVCNISPDQPLTGPNDGEYWRTDFYLAQAVTPLYSGPAIVSDQYEGVCGHERWYFAPGLGIVEIESLNDGAEMKSNPVCAQFTQAMFWDARYTIKRTN